MDIALNEVPLFIRAGRCIPVAKAAQCVAELQTDSLELLGYPGAEYVLYDDDGEHKSFDAPANRRLMKKAR